MLEEVSDMKTSFLILLSCLSVSAFATPTWQRAHDGYEERDYYSKNRPSAPSIDELISETCLNEAETVQVFTGGKADYDYNTYYFEDLICCGKTLKCPRDADSEQYE